MTSLTSQTVPTGNTGHPGRFPPPKKIMIKKIAPTTILKMASEAKAPPPHLTKLPSKRRRKKSVYFFSVSVHLSTLVKRFGVPCMRDFYLQTLGVRTLPLPITGSFSEISMLPNNSFFGLYCQATVSPISSAFSELDLNPEHL